MLDRLITGARVFDGQEFLIGCNVGIAGDTIAYVGAGTPEARSQDDAAGRILSPTFVDCHNHADFHCLDAGNDGFSALSQGVGTLVVGNCGMSATPSGKANPVLMPSKEARNVDLAEHQQRLRAPLPVDVADLLGHGTLRLHVMGEARPATATEAARMADRLDAFLEGGGLGLSVGLNYPEACGYDEAELLPLCRVLAKHGRPLTCHIRDQGAEIMAAVEEVARWGDQTGCPVHISHLRPLVSSDHLLEPLLERIDSGERLSMDLYPYVAGFTSLEFLFHSSFQKVPRSDDLLPPEEVEAKAREICGGGLADIHILKHEDPEVVGRTVVQVAAARAGRPGRVAQDLYLEDPGCLSLYDNSSRPAAVERVIRQPKCLIGSDGYLFASGFSGLCHPRNFGAFVGYLVRYVRAGKIGIEEGLAKITSRAAALFNLNDRGEIKAGLKANLNLFSLEKLAENADFAQPTRPARGMDEVILAGQTVWRDQAPVREKRMGKHVCPGRS